MSEPKIPAPLLVNLRAAAEHDATAAEADRQMKDLDAHIGELERALAAAKASHAEFGRQHTEATKHAEMHKAMVVGLCTAQGWPVPELPAAPEPPPVPEPPRVPAIDESDPLGLGHRVMSQAAQGGYVGEQVSEP